MRVVKAKFGRTIFEPDVQNKQSLGEVLVSKLNNFNRSMYNLLTCVCSTAKLEKNEKDPQKTNVIGNKTEGGLLILS